jgi:DNA-binding PadR family transcriptional regulator
VPLDASRNSLVLPLLGLLVEQPAHAYDLAARLLARYPHLHVTRSTVTSLLKGMEKAGMVAPRTPQRVGSRPPRTAYELTGAGLADFSRRIEAGLRDAQPASNDFIMAVAYASVLPAQQVAAVLDARADRLAGDLGVQRERPDGVPEAHMLEVDYWCAVVATESNWISKLAARIRSHDIYWPMPELPSQERTRR